MRGGMPAGMPGFTPRARAHTVAPSQNDPVIVVPISDIAPPERDPNVQGFCEERMIAVLRAFYSGTALPPVEVKEKSDPQYASAGAGFPDLPVTVNRFDAEAFFSELQA